ncbi:OLC1v1014495C1 [Oldenlandia corymbosa var. corymbosa]|uniref:OLC1v1014495C1 n=1 Tax=Oldenlandia corymbosa var. corymbosa TaxID=529605 RepID=A0AAV1E0S7_OLDCO|nr:OLC1v1014495C1 [Oldenlandia corymbosa var. corymbosa]
MIPFTIPDIRKFPPTLKKLTLVGSHADWTEMSIIGQLPNLEVLKIKDNFFSGPLWETNDNNGFRCLKFLKLSNLDIQKWICSSDHFLQLRRLVINDCLDLEEIPSDLGELPTMEIIEVYGSAASVAESARQIQEAQRDICNEDFRVFIYPQRLDTDAFNITKVLDDHPDFSTFNNYLTQTQLAAAINSRATITVLAVDNGNIGSLSGKPTEVIKNILSVHIILDYYGATTKSGNMSKKSNIVTTLFQTSGKAIGQQGFLNITETSSGVSIGSAANGATLGTNLVGSIFEQPYNLSVLHVSSPIIPAGIESINSSKTSPPPAPSPKSHSPRSSPTPSMSPSDTSPPTSKPPRPQRAPATSPPQPNDPTAVTPAADAPAADTHHAAGAARLSLGVTFMVVSLSSAISMIW